jgi:hypothetical protein
MNLLPLTLKVELLNHLRSFDLLVKYQTLHYWVDYSSSLVVCNLLMFDGLFVSNKNMRLGELGTIIKKTCLSIVPYSKTRFPLHCIGFPCGLRVALVFQNVHH